ncbi:MAG: hypothetical protein AAB473_03750 [Patescibacteria group bacterium]
MRTIVIDLLRHGVHNNDYMTALGLDQVEASVRAHLHDVELDGAFHSEKNRAQEAVAHALLALHQRKVIMAQHGAFTVDGFFEGDIGADLHAAFEVIGDGATMGELIETWGAGETARNQVQSGLVGIATELSSLDPDKRSHHALVGYHGPLMGIAAVDTNTMPADFGFADIVRYTLENRDGQGWEIVSSTHLKCPLMSIVS